MLNVTCGYSAARVVLLSRFIVLNTICIVWVCAEVKIIWFYFSVE